MKHLLSLILVLGCSSSAPSQYERGTYPGAPPLRPGHGAPVVGQPSVTVRTVPQPNPKPQRLLPETPETQRQPGIWASGSVTPTLPLLFGVVLPYPEIEEKIDRSNTDMCAFTMMSAAAAKHIPRDVWRPWSVDTRRCLAARLYEHCAMQSLAYYRILVERLLAMDKRHEAMEVLTVEKAMEFKKQACKAPLPKDVLAYELLVRTQWDAQHMEFIRKDLERR
jgi:hypothetical protein